MSLQKIYDCPNKVSGFISLACYHASYSTQPHRIGSVVIIEGKPVSFGYNSSYFTKFNESIYCTCHAEMDALYRAFHNIKGKKCILRAKKDYNLYSKNITRRKNRMR